MELNKSCRKINKFYGNLNKSLYKSDLIADKSEENAINWSGNMEIAKVGKGISVDVEVFNKKGVSINKVNKSSILDSK
jgi:hypothetical protein